VPTLDFHEKSVIFPFQTYLYGYGSLSSGAYIYATW